MIKIENLHKTFGPQVVLNGVSLDVARGETIAVVGPSGTGKSVLLKIITGLLLADSGEVIVDGRSMTGARTSAERRDICRAMGVLFQGAALFDSMTLLDNVAFPLRYRAELPEKEIVRRSLSLLDDVGLLKQALNLPGEVSIGMRKRVGIARSLVTRPDIILFDEPNTGLDPQMGQEIYDLIKETHDRYRFTGIVISHEIPEVFQVCDRVVMLYRGQVQVEGSVNEFLASPKPAVKQFIAGSIEGPIEIS